MKWHRDRSDTERAEAIQRAMRARARSAMAESLNADDERAAAALRGKAVAYRESADMVEAFLRGGRVRRKFRPAEATP